MELNTLADWESAGGAEMGWRLAMADPPATFAVCRHYASWMKMFRLFLLSTGHEGTEHVAFLDAVDELQEWAPHAALARKIYDLYLNPEKDDRRSKIKVPLSIRQPVTDAFAADRPPAQADVFEGAYREVVLLVNEGPYRDFQTMASRLRARRHSDNGLTSQVIAAVG